MTQLITREFLRREGACYTDAHIAALVPESGLTALELLKLDIPAQDRIWGITRRGVIERETMREWLTRLVGRADAAAAAADAAYAADAAASAAAAADAADADAAAAAERQTQINDMIELLVEKRGYR